MATSRPLRPRLSLESLECRTTPSAGDLDLSFSGDGKQVDLSPFGGDQAEDVLVLPNGKVLAVGYVTGSRYEVGKGGVTGFVTGRDAVIVRFNADGSLDTTFDGDGIAVLHLPEMGVVGFRAVAL